MSEKKIILESCELPAVPMVATRILQLANSSNANLTDLQDLIMADQALAARVIRMANSAFYGLSRTIDTISDAILVMGFATIKNLALAVSTKDVYKNFGLLEQKMWEHSIGVSVAAGMLAREVRFFKPEEAVMAGLLHDMGKAVMNNSQPEKFLILTQRVYEERVTYASIEQEMFGFSHALVGGIFAEKWEFPEFLCDVISQHHTCEVFDALDREDPNKRLLCQVVSLADAMCVRLGIGYRGPMEDMALDDDKWKKSLGISEQRFGEIVEEFKDAYIKEKMLYQ